MSGVQDIRDGGKAPLPRADRYAAGKPVGFPTSLTPEITIAFLALTLVAVLAAIVRKVRGHKRPDLHVAAKASGPG